jgi:hypothetical protein
MLDAVISWQGASDATITGLVPAAEGQLVTILNHAGTGRVITFAPLDSGSLAANRLHNVAVSAGTPVASLGSITYVYVQGYWRLIAHEQGAWITPTFSAAHYAATGAMTWTVSAGQVLSAKYRVSGKTLQWGFDIRGGTLGGTASTVFTRALFGGFTVAPPSIWGFANAAVAGVPMAAHASAGTVINFYRDPTFVTNWPLGALNVTGSGHYEIT